MSSSRKHPSQANDEPWTMLIGEITSTRGLHGEVSVFPHTDFPERFLELREIGLRRDGDVRKVRVKSARLQGRMVVLKLEGVNTIDDAEALRGTQLTIPESWRIELGEDEYYHDQLLGLEVVTTSGESLGKITHILETGANDVYETPLAMVPATKDMIREIDLHAGRMLVDARPGLRKRDSGD